MTDKPQIIDRSSVTGRFVTAETAAADPTTHQREARRAGKWRRRAEELAELRAGDQVLIERWGKLVDQQQAKLDAVRELIPEWQANADSRALGDPRAHVWHEAAHRLRLILDGTEGGE